MIYIQKFIAFLYINNELSKGENKKTIHFKLHRKESTAFR